MVGLLHVVQSGELLSSGRWLSVDVDRVVGRLECTRSERPPALCDDETSTNASGDGRQAATRERGPETDCDFDLSRHLLLLACLKQIRLSRKRKLHLPPRKRAFVAPLIHHILPPARVDAPKSRRSEREALRRAYVKLMRTVLNSTDRETLSAICDYGATCIGGMAGHRLDHMSSACEPSTTIATREM